MSVVYRDRCPGCSRPRAGRQDRDRLATHLSIADGPAEECAIRSSTWVTSLCWTTVSYPCRQTPLPVCAWCAETTDVRKLTTDRYAECASCRTPAPPPTEDQNPRLRPKRRKTATIQKWVKR